MKIKKVSDSEYEAESENHYFHLVIDKGKWLVSTFRGSVHVATDVFTTLNQAFTFIQNKV